MPVRLEKLKEGGNGCRSSGGRKSEATVATAHFCERSLGRNWVSGLGTIATIRAVCGGAGGKSSEYARTPLS